MAAKFGATIVPFGVVGEDDIVEVTSNIRHSFIDIIVGLVYT